MINKEVFWTMATKKVEMAVRDPKTKKLVVDEVEVQTVTVNVRNRDLRRSGGHVFNSIICGEVKFKPGEIKTLEISEAEVAEIKSRRNGAWELTTAAPTPPALVDDDEDIREPTSSEASLMAAAAEEQAAGELLDATVADDDGTPAKRERVQRVQRRDRR
jgi:hypothetical protein